MSVAEYASPERYAAAFRALQREGIPKKHIRMLNVHASAPLRTVSWPDVACEVGYSNEEGVKLQYGLFAHRVANELGIFKVPGFWSNVLFRVADNRGPNGRYRYKLLPAVVEGAVAAGVIVSMRPTSPKAGATGRRLWLPEARTTAGERKWISEFVASQTWIFARSMPQWPHWYIIRGNYNWCRDYDRLAALIKRYGVADKWGAKRWLYARFGDFKYWRLGDFINRAEPIRSAEVRQRGEEWLKARGMQVGLFGHPRKRDR